MLGFKGFGFKVQRFRGSKVQGSEVQRFRGSRVQRFKVQRFKGSRLCIYYPGYRCFDDGSEIK